MSYHSSEPTSPSNTSINDQNLSKADTSVKTPSVITDKHISRFQRRYQLHFCTSLAVLLLVLILTSLAIYIFLFPQEIDKPTGSIEALLQLQTAVKGQEVIIKSSKIDYEGEQEEALVGTRTVSDVLTALEFYERAVAKRLLLQAKEKILIATGYFSDLESANTKEELDTQKGATGQYLELLRKILEATQDRFKDGEVTRTDVAAVESRLAAATTQLELISQRYETAVPAAAARTRRADLDTLALVGTSLVRFGGVTVILFLISILVPIYRHNVRLASFYLARADSLILSRDSRVDDFGQLTNLLTPTISFDKEPRTPVESVSSLVKEATKLTRGG